VVLAIVAIAVAVPVVIVIKPSMRAIPIAGKELVAIVPRSDPSCAFIGRPRPISVVPPVMTSNGIPIAVNPEEAGSWGYGPHPHHSRRGRRADSDTNGNFG
jgi:hypothetical protein